MKPFPYTLLPCPLCGDEVFVTGWGITKIQCHSCDLHLIANSDSDRDRKELVLKWNRRTGDRLDKEIKL
jgi:hypothetical protein